MVLPYRRQAYYTRLSGLAVETAMAGIPMIYTKDTWLEDAIEEYGSGLPMENENVEDLVAQILKMYLEIQVFKKHALTQASQAKAYHSAEHFMKKLWG